MALTTIVLPIPADQGNITVTTSATNLLQTGVVVTTGSNTGGVPIGNADAYAIVVKNTGATDMTVTLWLSAGPNAGLQAMTTASVTTAAPVWTYQMSGNAGRFLALTAATAAGTTTAKADLNGVRFP